ncbi:hypothetical protein BH09ACT9_BH09ACT9_00090 [soil metagenome]
MTAFFRLAAVVILAAVVVSCLFLLGLIRLAGMGD